MQRDFNRGRLRSRQACLNCRKKIRCPAERPACSNCVRLRQSCSYGTGDPRQSDRLAYLESKVELLLSSSGQSFHSDKPVEDVLLGDSPKPVDTPTERPPEERPNDASGSPKSANTHHTSSRGSQSQRDSMPSSVDFLDHKLEVSQPSVAEAVALYFDLFYRQPIWCFDRYELENKADLPPEVIGSIMELTARVSRQRDTIRHGDNARCHIMLRVAHGTVELETIESLCLLSYSAFIDGEWRLGQFYMGLGFQLCRSAKMDRQLASSTESPTVVERKRRLLWSLQSLEQFYSEQDGVLGAAPNIWRPYYVSSNSDLGFPRDIVGSTESSDIGIWSFAAHFGWVWSRTREYVSDCSHNKLTEPWRLDSMYAKVLADMTEIENKIPWRHRYESAKFHERQAAEVRLNRDYWIPWIKLQFTWHATLTVLNHPFLYIAASYNHPSLAIPNTFWRKSSELVLLHATWIARMVDMVSDKQLQLVDPFFGHAAAIAATVHLYFCCAVDQRLKQKSMADLRKCTKFLKHLASFSKACDGLAQSLDETIRIASGKNYIDDDWSPLKIHLSVPLMWNILQFKVSASQETSFRSFTLLHRSLSSPDTCETPEQDSTLEISVASSPRDVPIDPATAHNASLPPYITVKSPTPVSQVGAAMGDIVIPPAETPMLQNPQLWADLVQLPDSVGGFDFDSPFPDRFSSWWDFANL